MLTGQRTRGPRGRWSNTLRLGAQTARHRALLVIAAVCSNKGSIAGGQVSSPQFVFLIPQFHLLAARVSGGMADGWRNGRLLAEWPIAGWTIDSCRMTGGLAEN